MADFHMRRENFLKDPNFYFLRLGAVYWLSNRFTFAGGLAHLWSANEFDDGYYFAGEKRIYQQLQWREKFNNLFFLFRIRNEQRWHEVLDEDAFVDRVRFSNRLRFLFSTTIPIFRNDNLPRLTIANELLVHFGKEIVYNTFDQNRFFIGIRQKMGRNLSLDFGYMLVYRQRYSGYQYDSNHTLRLFFYYAPDFRDKRDAELDHYPLIGGE